MKYTVKIAEQTYEVEIEDLNKRPVIARIGDEVFEVSLENSAVKAIAAPGQAAPASKPASRPAPQAAPAGASSAKAILAPLPGTVTEINIKPGDSVQTGQSVCVIDAMKMKNAIRATRSGKIASVAVTVGQSVTHRQVLVEFES